MPDRNYFAIKGRLPSLNDNINACRTHWAKGAKLKRDTEYMIFWQIISARNRGFCRPITEPVVVFFLWHENGERRDADNVYSAKKYILDAMQTAAIIPNDNRKIVVDCVDLGIVPAQNGQDGVEVLIMEVNPNEWSLRNRCDACLLASRLMRGNDADRAAGENAGREEDRKAEGGRPDAR